MTVTLTDAMIEAAAFSLFRDERTNGENDRFPPPEEMLREAWSDMADPESEWGFYSPRSICLRRARRALEAAIAEGLVPE